MKKRAYYVSVEEVESHQTIGSLIRRAKEKVSKKETKADRYVLRFRILNAQINELLIEIKKRIRR
jgi:hypothetical protein